MLFSSKDTLRESHWHDRERMNLTTLLAYRPLGWETYGLQALAVLMMEVCQIEQYW